MRQARLTNWPLLRLDGLLLFQATHVLFRTRDGGPGLFVVLVASGLLRQVDAARLRTYLPVSQRSHLHRDVQAAAVRSMVMLRM